MAVMPSHKLTSAAPAYPYNINARLAPHHYALLVGLAEAHDIGLSEALRLVLDELIDGHVDAELRAVLKIAAEITPDPEWVKRHGARGDAS